MGSGRGRGADGAPKPVACSAELFVEPVDEEPIVYDQSLDPESSTGLTRREMTVTFAMVRVAAAASGPLIHSVNNC